MDKHDIISLLNKVAVPVYQIEANLGMPKTTLQKAIKGERKLPKKWALKLLENYLVNISKEEVLETMTENAKDEVEEVKIKDLPKYAETAAEKMKRLIEEKRKEIQNNKK